MVLFQFVINQSIIKSQQMIAKVPKDQAQTAL